MSLIKLCSIAVYILIANLAIGQKTIVSGTVIDATTKETVPFATVSFKGTKTGTTTDIDGKYRLESYYSSDTLLVTFLGYNPYIKYIKQDKSQVINVEMISSDMMLKEFEIVGSKKDENPAHAIIRQMIANKKINNRVKLDAYEYEVYNKIEFDINNLDEKFMNRKAFRKFDFVFDMIDSTDDKPYLPIFIIESLSDYYYSKNPKHKKEIIKATKISGPENESISQYLGDMYQNSNIYDNTIYIFGRQFISPTNNNMLLHYKTYLTDSAFIDKSWCYKIKFIPKRKSDLAFTGEMWINDTTFAIKVIEAEISESANINYINSYKLKQTFEQVENEVWMMVLDETVADINPLESDKQKGFYGRKTTSYKDFVINKPKEESFYTDGNNISVKESAQVMSDEFWQDKRHVKLSDKENKIYHMIDTIKDLPVIKTYIDVIQTLVTGYKIIGPIEIGPYSSLYSFNPIEGHRFSLGLQTSNKFSKRIMFKGHAAYGLTDENWKYELGTKFFVTKTKSPRRMMDIKYINEVKQFDRDFFDNYNQSIISSFFRRNPYNKLLNIEGAKVEYYHEWFEGLANTISIESYNMEALGNVISFSKTTNSTRFNYKSIQNTQVSFGMRFAKDEKFVSGEFNRISLGSTSPIVNLNVDIGVKGFFNSNYNYQKVKLNVTDKLFFGYLGYFKYSIEAGKIWGAVPYPFLFVHQGNETYGYSLTDFNAMNIGEFMSDEYASLSMAHYFGGLFLNRIPLLRRLKWRELVTAKVVYGRLNDKHSQVLDLPNFSSSLTRKPYMEVSAGVENIFKVIRIDALWRLSYLDNKSTNINVLRFGIRAKLQFEF
jgi:hypothetical protein|tara:strand:+ start:54 stop:2543 length:2490 start_codon:yes stop_codon:yes gene_type:complete